MKCKNCKCSSGQEENLVFETDSFKFEIENRGHQIIILRKGDEQRFVLNYEYSLPLLEKAIDRARELRGEK